MKAKKQDYQALKQELDEVLAKLQRDDTEIDTALEHYKRGLELTKQLETYLEEAENQITKLQADGV